MAVRAVKLAKSLVADVEFPPKMLLAVNYHLCEVITAVIAAGATVINIPDTVGYALPWEFGEFIGGALKKRGGANIEQAVISVHCHNDLGMAVANSLAAVRNGARQIEVAVNGIGSGW